MNSTAQEMVMKKLGSDLSVSQDPHQNGEIIKDSGVPECEVSLGI